MKLLELVAGTRPTRHARAHGRVRRRGAGQGHRLRQGHHQLHRQPHRRLRDDADHLGDEEGGCTVEEVDKIFGPRDGPPQVGRVPHRGPRRPGHLHPRGEELLRHADQRRGARDASRSPTFIKEMVQEGLRWATRAARASTRREGRGRQGDPRARPEDARVPAAEEGPLRVAGRGQGRRGRARARRTVMSGDGQGGEVRREGHPGRARLRLAPHPGDRRRRRQRRPRHALGLRLGPGPFETWDAYGVKKGVERMKALGIKPAAVGGGDARAPARDASTAWTAATDTYWDIPQKAVKPVPENRADHSRRVPQARQQEAARTTTAPRSGTWATACCCSSSTRR